MTVADHEIEITFLEQMIFNSRHDQRRVPFADLRNKHADRVAPLLPQGSRKMIRSVIQLSSCRTNQFLGSVRNRLGGGNSIDHQGDSRLRESQMFRESFQTDTFSGVFLRLRRSEERRVGKECSSG